MLRNLATCIETNVCLNASWPTENLLRTSTSRLQALGGIIGTGNNKKQILAEFIAGGGAITERNTKSVRIPDIKRFTS
jgi:hypothetical protein